MSPTRRHFLYGSLGLAAAGAVGVGRASRAAAPSGRRLVMVYLDGAWDPTYHIDPKLDTPFVDGPEALPSDAVADETVETIHGHRLAINRTTRAPVAEFFERWGREVVSLSGVTIGGIAHNPNRTRVLTGTPDRRRPDLVTWLGSQESVTEPLGALDLSGWGLQGARGADATRAGAGWQLHTLLAGNEGLGAHLGHDPVADDLVEDFLRRRAARLPPGPRADYGRSLERSVGRLEGMRDHAEPLAAILGRSPRLPENHALVAADLVARGFARSVLIDPGFHFDTHANNAIQERLTHDLYAMLDVLMTALTEQGALDHMLGFQPRMHLHDLDVFRFHEITQRVEIDAARPRWAMVPGRKLDVVDVKSEQALGHRRQMLSMVDEAEVLLDLRVPGVVPVAHDLGREL